MSFVAMRVARRLERIGTRHSQEVVFNCRVLNEMHTHGAALFIRSQDTTGSADVFADAEDADDEPAHHDEFDDDDDDGHDEMHSKPFSSARRVTHDDDDDEEEEDDDDDN